MSNPVGAQRYGLGGGDAYYDAVKYGGYTGTREQFGRDQAEFAENATAVAEAREEVERNTQTVVNTTQTFTEETVPAAIQSVEEKGNTEEDRLEARTTELVQSINTAGAVQAQAVEDEGTEQIGLVSGAGTAQVEAVEQAGEDQVDAVEQAGSTQVENVNSAGTTQVGNVNQAGTTQVGNVNTAGAAQVQAVEDKGDEVLESIPGDYTELVEEVDNLKTAVDDNLLNKKEVVNPDNWLNLNAITDGELLANGTVSASTTRFYTDFIPVEQGNKMRGYRTTNPIDSVYRRHICLYDENKSVVSGGSDNSSDGAFTIPSGVAYCRMTFDKNILSLNLVIVNTGTAPTKFTAYFEPYEIYTEDFLTPESKEVVQKITNKSLTTADLANGYKCAFPRTKFRQTVGLPEAWYYKNAIYPDLTCYASIGSQYQSFIDGGNLFPNNTALNSANGYTFSYVDPLGTPIETFTEPSGYGQERHIIAENLSDCSLLAIGDSTVDSDTMTQKLLDYFTSKSKTLTLLGTLGSGSNKNEGRAGWKATDYLTNKQYKGVVNPFYNPTTETFDFSYYMTNQGYSAPDFVVIQIGINDVYNVNRQTETTWQAVKTMIDSIRTYNNSIKVLLNLPAALNSDVTKHSIVLYTARRRVLDYTQYALAETKKTYSENNVRCSYCHLILDPATDVQDSVHPTTTGYEKMAKEIINQINCWQNGA